MPARYTISSENHAHLNEFNFKLQLFLVDINALYMLYSNHISIYTLTCLFDEIPPVQWSE